MAASLSEQFQAPLKRNALIDDALGVLDAEVQDKSGISGLAVKGAFKVVKGIQPGFLRKVVDKLLGDFLSKLEPFYQDALNQGLPPGGMIEKQRNQFAGALLSVTDAKVADAQDMVKMTYQKLRPSAEKHVEAAAPRIAQLLNKHAARA